MFSIYFQHDAGGKSINHVSVDLETGIPRKTKNAATNWATTHIAAKLGVTSAAARHVLCTFSPPPQIFLGLSFPFSNFLGILLRFGFSVF